MHRLGGVVLGLVVLALTAGLVVAAPAASTSPAGTAPTDVTADPPPLGLDECAAEPPADFSDPADEETIGWFDGVWYNEPIDVDMSQEGGLTDGELDLVIARTMARWEALRCLPFIEAVNVSVIDRETFREEQGTANVSNDTRLFDNAQAKALFLVDETEDSVEVAEANRGEAVLGYYSITDQEIVLVSGEDETLHVDESTLAHELGHALQDQHFGFDDWGRNTTDARMAELGLIEGDVVFVQRVYEGHCEAGAWAGDCLEPPEGTGAGDLANIGLFLIMFQPYSDGPNFANHHYEAGGWEAVDAIYDEWPDSAKEVMYPDLYGEFDPQPPTLEDRSSDDWRLIERSDGPVWDQLGEPALFTAFMFPNWHMGPADTPIVSPDGFFNVVDPATGDLDPLNPYDYSSSVTEGWVGDRFKAFVDADGDDAIGYTLAIRFEDPAGAQAFLSGYEELLAFHNADPHPDKAVPGDAGGVFLIDDADSFGGAYWVHQEGEEVLIVHAPTVDELEGVHAEVAFEEVGTPTPDITPTPTDPIDATPTPTPPPDDQPGFGLVLAAVALGLLAVLVRTRLSR